MALDGVIGLMLVVVSTPSASCSRHFESRTLHCQHFIRLRGPQTRLANLLTTQGTLTITSICWIHISKHKQLSGILYFPVMFLLNAGATVAIAVGFVSMFWFPLRNGYTFDFFFWHVHSTPGYDALSLSAIVVISNIMVCSSNSPRIHTHTSTF